MHLPLTLLNALLKSVFFYISQRTLKHTNLEVQAKNKERRTKLNIKNFLLKQFSLKENNYKGKNNGPKGSPKRNFLLNNQNNYQLQTNRKKKTLMDWLAKVPK